MGEGGGRRGVGVGVGDGGGGGGGGGDGDTVLLSYLVLLHGVGEHDDVSDSFLPHHPPHVLHSVAAWTCVSIPQQNIALSSSAPQPEGTKGLTNVKR